MKARCTVERSTLTMNISLREAEHISTKFRSSVRKRERA